MSGQEHSHGGHRERMREKYLAGGLGAMPEHEALELILYYPIRRRNVNNAAHELLKGTSLNGLAGEEIAEISRRRGIGEQSALFVSLVLAAAKRYPYERNSQGTLLNSFAASSGMAKRLLYSEREPKLIMFCLNAACRLVGMKVLAKGRLDRLDAQEIIDTVLRYRAHSVILAHNHLNGDVRAGEEDMELAQEAVNALNTVDIKLLDHIIVSGYEAYGMSGHGHLKRDDEEQAHPRRELIAADSDKRRLLSPFDVDELGEREEQYRP